MNIGVAFDEGQIAANLGSCKQVLVVTTEGREPVSKHMAEVRGTSTTDLIKLASMEQIDVLICGSLGLAIRNALEMIGVLLVPGCEGPAEEAVAKFLVGEKQGDPTCSRSAARRTRMTRWRACMTARSAPAAARASC